MAQPKKPIIDLPPRDLTLAALDKARKERLAASPPLTNVKAGAGMLSSSGVGGSTGGGSGGGGGGGGGAPAGASYWTRVAESGLSNESNMSALSTGYVKVTTGTGVPSSQAVPIPATDGGTGQTSYAVGDLLYASTTTALSKLADVATGNVLISGGVNTAPAYGKVGLTTHVSGTLAVGNGGTGATTLTGVLFGNGTSAFTAYNSFTDNHIVRADGTGKVQTTGWTIDDDDLMSISGAEVDYVKATTSASGSSAAGAIHGIGSSLSAGLFGENVGTGAGVFGTNSGSGAGVRGTNSHATSPAISAGNGNTAGPDYESIGSGIWQSPEISSSPSTPASSKGIWYVKTDGKMYFKNDAGTEYDLTATGTIPALSIHNVADADYTASTSDNVIVYTSISVARTVSLPSAATYGSGVTVTIKDGSGSVTAAINITIDPNSTETIDGAGTKKITSAYGSLTILSNGSNWYII